MLAASLWVGTSGDATSFYSSSRLSADRELLAEPIGGSSIFETAGEVSFTFTSKALFSWFLSNPALKFWYLLFMACTASSLLISSSSASGGSSESISSCSCSARSVNLFSQASSYYWILLFKITFASLRFPYAKSFPACYPNRLLNFCTSLPISTTSLPILDLSLTLGSTL